VCLSMTSRTHCHNLRSHCIGVWGSLIDEELITVGIGCSIILKATVKFRSHQLVRLGEAFIDLLKQGFLGGQGHKVLNSIKGKGIISIFYLRFFLVKGIACWKVTCNGESSGFGSAWRKSYYDAGCKVARVDDE